MTPQDPIQQEQQQTTQPDSFNRHKPKSIIMKSLVAVLTCLLIFASIQYLSIFNVCNERDEKLQSAVASTKDHLNALSINGSTASEVETRRDGDCITGHGAVGTASFTNLSPLSVNEANAQVVKSLNSSTSQKDQVFTLEDTDGNDLVDSIQTTLTNGADNKNYKISYFLAHEIVCPDYDDRYKICIQGETPADVYSRMTKPIAKVELTLRTLTN